MFKRPSEEIKRKKEKKNKEWSWTKERKEIGAWCAELCKGVDVMMKVYELCSTSS